MTRTPLLLLSVLALSACSSGGSTASLPRGSATYGSGSSASPASPALTPGSASARPLVGGPAATSSTGGGSAAGGSTGTGSVGTGSTDTGSAGTGSTGTGSVGAGGGSAPGPSSSGTTTTRGQAPPAAVRPGDRPVAARPGTYTRDTTGTVTLGSPGTPQDASGTATLTVARPSGGVQHTTAHSDQGDTGQDVLFRSNGVYASRLTLTTKAFTKDFRPSPAVLLLPQPARGSWTWSTVSTDGKTTIKATNAYVRSETLTIGGKAVPCVVVQSRLVLSGDVDLTIDLTSWEATALHLVAKDHTKTKGTYSGFAFSSDTTSVLRSTDPS